MVTRQSRVVPAFGVADDCPSSAAFGVADDCPSGAAFGVADDCPSGAAWSLHFLCGWRRRCRPRWDPGRPLVPGMRSCLSRLFLSVAKRVVRDAEGLAAVT